MPHPTFWHTPLLVAPRVLRPWLSHTRSLTQRLMTHFDAVNVRVLYQGLRRAHRDEVATLHIHTRSALVATREVLLCSGDTPLVFAHTLQRGLKSGVFARSGNRPLGALLFADPSVRRSTLSWRKLDARHPLWQKASAAAGYQAATLWARRSIFYSGNDQLLVTEVFLSPIFTP